MYPLKGGRVARPRREGYPGRDTDRDLQEEAWGGFCFEEAAGDGTGAERGVCQHHRGIGGGEGMGFFYFLLREYWV